MTKSKVLILHGFGSSNVISSRQTPNLRAQLEAIGLDLEYPHGPNRLTPKDFPFADVHDCEAQPLWCWWHFIGEEQNDLTKMWRMFENYEGKDDIVGVIGISQGGAVTNLIAMKGTEVFPNLKFAVGYGGFLYPSPYTAPEMTLYSDGIHIPYLTVYGENDVDVNPEASQKVHDTICKAEKGVVSHNCGHTFADDDPATVESVVRWVKQFV